MSSIAADGIRKEFGSLVALEDVSFDVDDGEFFCLLGPSGAGKTTTLKVLAGLEEPQAGDVRISGRDVNGVEPSRRDLAMCFESYALYPQYDVFANLASPLRSPRNRVDEDRVPRRVQQVAETLTIDHLLDRSVTQLSNGQRQRVALGRVLVRPAAAYLLDEPLTHLDAKLRATMRAELKALSQSDRTTTIYVTHDYVEALSLADRVGVLAQGRIVQVGTPVEIWERPANVFVAEAFGKPRINLIPAALTTRDGGQHARGADGAEVPVRLDRPLADDTSVVLGVRPRDLRLHTGAGDLPAGLVPVVGEVYVLEHLGRQTEVTVRVGDTLLALIVPRSQTQGLARDERVTVLVDPERVHVFLPGPEGERVSAAVGS